MTSAAEQSGADGRIAPSVVANQRQIYLRLVAQLQPQWRTDQNLPARLQKLFAAHRNFGSRDRRLYRELVYTTIRYLPWIEPLLESAPEKAADLVAWLAEETPATRAYRAALTTGRPPRPAPLAAKAALIPADPTALLPAWLRAQCPAAFADAEIDSLHRRAPLWLRAQTADLTTITAEFDQRAWPWRVSSLLPHALEVLAEADVTQSDAYRNGRFEIQDLGSQLILESLGLSPGGHWLDACAGAGGKTLQLAHLLGPTGKIDAYDIRPAALAELALRAKRAGLRNIRVLPQPPAAAASYDGVLVDAPCSGSGTWRRSPHLKWVTTPAMIADYAARQAALLDQHAARVRPGGQLVYATCSLNRQENTDVARAFTAAHPDFTATPPARDFGFASDGVGRAILPARHDTDGFYVAAWRRA